MAKDFQIEANEVTLRITAPSGDTLELDRESNLVEVAGNVDYGIFMKLVKELKRHKNKESFSVEYYED